LLLSAWGSRGSVGYSGSCDPSRSSCPYICFHSLSCIELASRVVISSNSLWAPPPTIRLSFACLSGLFGTDCFFSDVLASLFSLWPFLFSFVCCLTIIFIILQSFSLFRVGSNFRFCRRSFRVSSHFSSILIISLAPSPFSRDVPFLVLFPLIVPWVNRATSPMMFMKVTTSAYFLP